MGSSAVLTRIGARGVAQVTRVSAMDLSDPRTFFRRRFMGGEGCQKAKHPKKAGEVTAL
jgi:hypothetical protein